MPTVNFYRVLLLLPAILALGCMPKEPPVDPPNIVFIIADDLSWKHLGIYGCNEFNTPAIDRLAAEGVVFENAFVSAPSCTPSRAAILTGRNGFELEEGASLWGFLPAKFPTYTELLAENGYRTGSTGKGWAPGFLIDREINPAGSPYNRIKYKPYDSLFKENAISDIDYAGNFKAFLKTTDPEKPFCFWIGTFEPHRGYTPGLAASLGINADKVTVPAFMPDAKEVREDIAEYYAETQHIDRQVAGILQVLEEQGKLDNTLILFTSDNGMPFPRAKASLYDYGTHMPLIAWWGTRIRGGRSVSDLISFTDFAPTFLELAGIDIPQEMSGKSFAGQLSSKSQGQIEPARKKVYFYRERHGFYQNTHGATTPSRGIRTDEYLLIWNANTDSLHRDVDGGPSKSYMEENQAMFPDLYDKTFGRRPEYELYDIQNDLFQMTNLAGSSEYSEIFEDLKTDLFSYLGERHDPRITGDPESFTYNPYFGFAFAEGLLQWTPEQQGQELTFYERREILQKAYSMRNEEEFFNEMIRRQHGKL